MQQHSDIAGRAPRTVLDVPSNCTALRAEEWNTMEFCGENPPLVRKDYSISRESRSSKRKPASVKGTLREKNSVIEYFLGTMRKTTTTKFLISRETSHLISYCEQDQHEHETSYTIYPATWLIRLGIHHGLRLRFFSSSTQGWKNTIKTFRPISDDALIFEYCKQGDVSGVRFLLSEGHASVRDTDSQGYTPLHVSLVHEINTA